MGDYGIFISYRRTNWKIADRVFDYLHNKGYRPFIDTSEMHQGEFPIEIENQIKNSPYFLCVLSHNSLKDLKPDDWLLKELELALKYKKNKDEILLLAEKKNGKEYCFPQNLPVEINDIRNNQVYSFDRDTFSIVLNKLCKEIDNKKLYSVLDWHQEALCFRNVYLTSRNKLEHGVASLENRFGAVFSKDEYTVSNKIRRIRMACYAANIIFTNERQMIDSKSYDLGKMGKTIRKLLQDDEFNFEIIINAPESLPVKDAIANKKLGNDALENNPCAIFLGTYFRIQQLIKEDEIFKKAVEEKRFKFMVTDSVLPYALFFIDYKDDYTSFNHVKIDLYSEQITSSIDRRSMLIFADDVENYGFFTTNYENIRRKTLDQSERIIKEYENMWLSEWEIIKKELSK